MNAHECVIKLLKQAAVQLRAQRGRVGNMVHLTDANDVLVGGDLHGNLGNFQRLQELADLANNQSRHLVLQEFVHGKGRYAGGGCTSHRLVDALAALVCKFPERVHLLLGNHELSELTGRSIAKNGAPLNELFAHGVSEAYGEHADQVTEHYHELYLSMPLAIRTPNRVLMTHSIPPGRFAENFDVGIFTRLGFADEQAVPGSTLYSLLWGRDVSEANSRRFAERMDVDFLITGHIACERGFDVPNSRQIILDCANHPAAHILFPARTPVTHQQLVEFIKPLHD